MNLESRGFILGCEVKMKNVPGTHVAAYRNENNSFQMALMPEGRLNGYQESQFESF